MRWSVLLDVENSRTQRVDDSWVCLIRFPCFLGPPRVFLLTILATTKEERLSRGALVRLSVFFFFFFFFSSFSRCLARCASSPFSPRRSYVVIRPPFPCFSAFLCAPVKRIWFCWRWRVFERNFCQPSAKFWFWQFAHWSRPRASLVCPNSLNFTDLDGVVTTIVVSQTFFPPETLDLRFSVWYPFFLLASMDHIEMYVLTAGSFVLDNCSNFLFLNMILVGLI